MRILRLELINIYGTHIMQRVKVELSWANNFTSSRFLSPLPPLQNYPPHGLLLLSVLVTQAHSWASVCARVRVSLCVCMLCVCVLCVSVCISGAAERALSAEGFMCTDMQLKGKDNKRLQIAQAGGKEPQTHTHTHTDILCTTIEKNMRKKHKD